MQPGNLVRIKRSGIGRPAGTLALVLEESEMVGRGGTKIFRVEMFGWYSSGTKKRLTGRYLEGDLELVS